MNHEKLTPKSYKEKQQDNYTDAMRSWCNQIIKLATVGPFKVS